jgi:thiol-disulfide isomerase/thioredoxin
MARTESTMLPLGTKAPQFDLPDTITGKHVQLNHSPQHIATVIMFICNHCPFVKHISPELTRLANDYIPKNIRFIAISSNDVVHYPDDAPELMKLNAEQNHYPFPYLYDETQEVAKAYQAACTPDFFVFDRELKLVYRGQLDDSRPGNNLPVNGESLRKALDCLLENKNLDLAQKPSIGCNIKWKN